jgi:hypothetical protein
MTQSRNIHDAALIGVASGVTTFAGAAAIGAGIDGAIHPAHAACAPGAKIDASTVIDARDAIANAGYSGVHNLKKGCDNYWHGIVSQSGQDSRVVLAPDGKVMPEGN